MIWAWRIYFKYIAQNGVLRTLCASGEHAQNGVLRTLCASGEHAQNGVVACFLVALLGTPLIGGSVMGRVELKDSRFSAVRKGRDYSGVVVWLLPAGGAVPSPAEGRHARLIQKDKTFTPHVLAIETGTTVDFPNFDPIFHNAFSNFSGQLFDIGLYPPGSSRSFRFERSGAVRIFCNIHPAMSAVILVVDTPYFAVSGRNGEFEIANVTPGEYQLNVFHERASEAVLQGLKRRIAVEAGNLPLAPMEISESGYLPEPHKNKYGKDYPKTVEDGVFYPGAPK
jgi:plastocyanin